MRISTSQSWNNALSNLMQAQSRQNQANEQVQTQKVATDLRGYGRSSEIVASYQSSVTRIEGYLSVNQTVADRLDTQNLALERVGEGAEGARQTILDALANGSANTMMQALNSDFAAVVDGLNFKHQGQYLFAGGKDDTAPVNVSTMAQAAALTNVADAFDNGTIKKSSQIDATTKLQTGMLADDLGSEVMQIYKDLYDYHASANGPLDGELNDAQQTFLTGIASRFATAYNNVLESTSLNGTYQNRVENAATSLTAQSTSLQGLLSDRTGVDLAEAYTKLEMATVSVNASAQVVANLKQTTLLDLLR
ncbi:flagellin [Asticcacaulis endophyticus]|uniref:Flagellin n=1 Tax=Asticcacaulis endophyticus TaxID=1395890 RepID=A0A918ULV8_9CAUL|nr:flagellin [Asticcacaulis endophyticus]GGZ19754.1 flagellin [Asticcacaulis endophyticus]